MKKLKIFIYNIINTTTIIWVNVLYGVEENQLLKYTGKVILPKNKYFKESVLNHFDNIESKVTFTNECGGVSYISDSKTPLHEMVRISLEKKLNIKIISISVLNACTI